MLAKIKKELLFAGVFRNSNEKVRKDILEDNRKAAIFWGAIQLIFWSFSLECVSKFGNMHFRRLELHFCVDFP